MDQPSDRMREQLEQLALACRILEMEGHGDLAQGHLSLRDESGSFFWMKRNDIGLGEVMGPEDFVSLSFEGQKLSGSGRPHSEWPIHSEIFKARDDVRIVAHSHPQFACLLTAAEPIFHPYTIEADKLTRIGFFNGTSALINDIEAGAEVAKALGEADFLFLANHGVVFCGATIAETVCRGIFLERAARVEVMAANTNLKWRRFPDADERALRHRQMISPGHIDQTWAYFQRKLTALHTGHDGAPKVVFGERI
ncbi:MAG TPA: class II aldolase/adducin family protein [Beijerinckiaceae bacterium]|jgi:ribulose-5-phosphate 4-epimerase/fuculose-1-phosphate aldolase|nr:class II aldolase/adducin family protein [Beijerinckiaceae bacterium]